ncbi:MAG: uracil-DNA glycosylase [Candidatus Omnitrophica bacterium]|nr:uracil-DNA glycosylase [Candidatus Omnitrophota bacterium]
MQMLKEDGIEEVYLAPASKPVAVRADAGPVRVKSSTEAKSVREKLIDLREQALKCTACEELASTRNKVVFGAGNVQAKLMFVGEAPGRDEDIQGLPFVGKAGQLLTKIIESIGLKRSDVFIANCLRCRPPGNRTPKPEEILNCEPFLSGTIDLIQPKIICALGTFAAQALLKTGSSISQMRGRFHDYRGIPVLCTYHPAYLLRNPGEKRKVWEDMKKIKGEMDNLGDVKL